MSEKYKDDPLLQLAVSPTEMFIIRNIYRTDTDSNPLLP